MRRRERLARGVLIAGTVATLISIAGCGAVVTAGAIGAVLGLSGGGGSRGQSFNTPPKVEAAAISGSTDGGSVALDLTILDLQSDPTNAQVRFSIDPNENSSQLFKSVATGTFTAPGSTSALDASKLATSPGGASYVFTWNTAKDVGAVFAATARLQIVLNGFVAFTVPAFSVDNTAVPMVVSATFGALPNGATVYADAQAGNDFVPVQVVIANAQATPATLSVLFGSGDGTFPGSNVAVGDFHDSTGALVSGSPTLPTLANGGQVTYTFRWTSSANGITSQQPIQLQFVATSPTGRASAPSTTAVVQIENSTFSVVAGTPQGVSSDKVFIDYALLDSLSEDLSLSIKWAFQGGSFQATTGVNEAPNAGTTGLGSSQTGTGHTYIWNAFEDIQAALGAGTPPVGNIVIQLIVTKPKTQVSSLPFSTQPFRFDGRFIDTVLGKEVGAAENVPATSAPILGPGAIAANAQTIFLCDTKANRVRAVSRSTGSMATYLGGGTEVFDGALAKNYSLTGLTDLALGDAALYVVGFVGVQKILRVDLGSTVVTTFVPPRAATPTGTILPTAIAFDATTDTIYYADANNYGPGGGVVSPGGPNPNPDPANFKANQTCQQIYALPESGGIPVAITGQAGYASLGNLNKGDRNFDDALIGTVFELRTGDPAYPNTLLLVDGIDNEVRAINMNPVGGATVHMGGVDVPAHFITTILKQTTSTPPGSVTPTTASFGGVAIEGTGIIDVSDFTNQVVYQLNDNGVLLVVAGTEGQVGFSGDGGPALSALFTLPVKLAEDPNAAGPPQSTGFFLADVGNTRIRRVDDSGVGGVTSGSIATTAGSFTNIGDGGLAIAAALADPIGVALLPGSVLIADTVHNRVRSVDTSTQVIATYAGNGSFSVTGDGQPAATAGISLPGPTIVDSSGDVFVAEPGNHVVRKIAAGTTIMSTVIGTPSTSSGLPIVNHTGADTAPLGSASGIALVNDNVLVVADAVRRQVYGVALESPATLCGVNLDTVNEYFVLAGTGAGPPANTPPPGSNPPAPFGTFSSGSAALHFNFYVPCGLAATQGATPTIYIVDQDLNEVFLVDAGGNLGEVAGSGAAKFYAQGCYDTAASHPVDGTPENVVAAGAALKLPTSALFDPATGALFVVDTGNDEIHVVNTSAAGISICGVGGGGFPLIAPGTITPVVGNGPTTIGSFTGDGGLAIQAGVALALTGTATATQSLALTSGGTLLFCDVANDRVRVVDSTGLIDTIAGGAFLDGDGGPADLASLTLPTTIACASDGSYAVFDVGRIRVVNPVTTIVKTFVGTGLSGFFDGPVASAEIPYSAPGSMPNGVVNSDFNGPRQMAFAPGSTLSPVTSAVIAIADTRSNTIRIANLSPVPYVLPPSGVPLVTIPPGQIGTILGDPSSMHAKGFIANGGTIGPGPAAVSLCDGVAFTPELIVFTHGDSPANSPAGPGSWTVRAINITAGNVSVGGTTLAPGSVWTLATTSQQPRQVATYTNGAETDLFWCQDGAGMLSNAVVYVLPLTVPLAATASSPNPYGIPSAKLPVAVGSSQSFVSTPSAANVYPVGTLTTPRGISADPLTGDVWICDRFQASSYVLGVLRSNGAFYNVGVANDPGFSGDGALASQAQLNQPVATAVDPSGNVFAIDGMNLKIRRARRYP